MRFTNSKMKITHLLIIHLKEEHMIELMNHDDTLINALKEDLDSEGNTCAHIAIMYDKQKVLDELLVLNPKF